MLCGFVYQKKSGRITFQYAQVHTVTMTIFITLSTVIIVNCIRNIRQLMIHDIRQNLVLQDKFIQSTHFNMKL